MAKTEQPAQTHPEPLVSLNDFAQSNAEKWGIELMGGFVYLQRQNGKLADTVSNYEAAINAFTKQKLG